MCHFNYKNIAISFLCVKETSSPIVLAAVRPLHVSHCMTWGRIRLATLAARFRHIAPYHDIPSSLNKTTFHCITQRRIQMTFEASYTWYMAQSPNQTRHLHRLNNTLHDTQDGDVTQALTGFSNNRPLDCLFNSLHRLTPKKKCEAPNCCLYVRGIHRSPCNPPHLSFHETHPQIICTISSMLWWDMPI